MEVVITLKSLHFLVCVCVCVCVRVTYEPVVDPSDRLILQAV